MLRAYAAIELAALGPRPLHLAIGMFDGVHLGHQAVIEAAVHGARRSGGLAAVLTFRPHPSRLFRPDRPTKLILGADAQAELLARLGVDAVITHPFTRDFAAIAAEAFLPWVRERQPALAAVYVGANWRFGAGRKGDVALLVAEGMKAGIAVYSAPPVHWNGETINSTRIRGCLEAGDIAQANALLGYAYFSAGAVTPGKRLGRQLGFPTLNLPWEPELLPRFGVYRVAVKAADAPAGSPAIPGVANYGVRPTVEPDAPPLLEIHLLGECPFGPGSRITAEWLQFVRPEMKFSSVEALKEQIARDVAAARS